MDTIIIFIIIINILLSLFSLLISVIAIQKRSKEPWEDVCHRITNNMEKINQDLFSVLHIENQNSQQIMSNTTRVDKLESKVDELITDVIMISNKKK